MLGPPAAAAALLPRLGGGVDGPAAAAAARGGERGLRRPAPRTLCSLGGSVDVSAASHDRFRGGDSGVTEKSGRINSLPERQEGVVQQRGRAEGEAVDGLAAARRAC